MGPGCQSSYEAVKKTHDLTGSLFKMHTLRSHSQFIELESEFYQEGQEIHMHIKLQKHCTTKLLVPRKCILNL